MPSRPGTPSKKNGSTTAPSTPVGKSSKRKQRQMPPSPLQPDLPRMPSIPSLPKLPTSESKSKLSSKKAKRKNKASTDDPSTDDAADDDEEIEELFQNTPRRLFQFSETSEDTFVTARETSEHNSQPDLHTGEEDDDKKQENIVVCVRVRPTNEKIDEEIYKITPQDGRLELTNAHPVIRNRGKSGSDDAYKFQYDALLLAPNPTQSLYDSKISRVIKASMSGFNGVLFAYGQTGSGKTHTMMGSSDEPGIIPLAIEEVFDYIQQNTTREFLLRMSYLEIYKEELKDLLAPGASDLRIITANDRITVSGLKEVVVSSPSSVLEYLAKGEANRHVGATDWNERSSRSHCMFQMIIESRERSTEEAVITKDGFSKTTDQEIRVSQLNLVDLAGSESAVSEEERRKEGAFINRSLLTLGNVITKLTEKKGKQTHIPFRDSKLTHLLKTSLSGNARVAIICTISPLPQHGTESINTLKFAQKAKLIVTKAARGVMANEAALIQKYELQIQNLQSQLAKNRELVDAAQRAKEDEENRAREQELRGQLEMEREEASKARREAQDLDMQRLALQNQLENLKTHLLSSTSNAPPSPKGKSGLGLGVPSIRNFANSRSFSNALDSIGRPKIGTLDKEVELEKALSTSQEETNVLRQKHGDLEKKLEVMQAKHLSAVKEKDFYIQEAGEQAGHIMKLERQLQDVQSANNSHAQSDSKLQNTIDELQTALEVTRNELSETSKHQRELQESIDNLRQSEKDLKSKLGALQEELANATHREKEALSNLASHQKDSVNKEKDLQLQLDKALKDSTEAIKCAKDLQGNVDRLTADATASHKREKELEAALDSISEAAGDTNQQQKALQDRVDALQKETKALAKREDDLKSQHDAAVKACEESIKREAQLKADLETATKGTSDSTEREQLLKSRLEASEARCETLQSTNQELEERTKMLTRTTSTLDETISTSANRVKALEDELAQARVEHASALKATRQADASNQTELQTLKDANDHLRAELERYNSKENSQVKETEDKLAASQAQLSTLLEDSEEKMSKIQQKHIKEVEKLQYEQTKLRKQVSQELEQIKVLTIQLESKQKVLEEYRVEIKHREEEAELAQADRITSEAQKAALEARIASLSSQSSLSSITLPAHNTSSDVLALQVTIDKQQEEIRDLHSSLRDWEQRVKQQKEAIRELQIQQSDCHCGSMTSPRADKENSPSKLYSRQLRDYNAEISASTMSLAAQSRASGASFLGRSTNPLGASTYSMSSQMSFTPTKNDYALYLGKQQPLPTPPNASGPRNYRRVTIEKDLKNIQNTVESARSQLLTPKSETPKRVVSNKGAPLQARLEQLPVEDSPSRK